jgi:hypothetical protein
MSGSVAGLTSTALLLLILNIPDHAPVIEYRGPYCGDAKVGGSLVKTECDVLLRQPSNTDQECVDGAQRCHPFEKSVLVTSLALSRRGLC